MKDKAVNVIKVVALSALVAAAGNGNAATLGLAQTPLFLGSAVQPNVFFVNDDSGSMDWSFMTQSYWISRAYDPDPTRDGSFDSWDSGWLETGGLMVSGLGNNIASYAYYYSNGDNVYGAGCSVTMEACNGFTPSVFATDWRSRSAGLTTIFYTTSATYQPWSGDCSTGVPCADANFFLVKSNPVNGEFGYNMTRNLATDGDANGSSFKYEVWIDDAGFNLADGRPKRGTRFNYTGVADINGLATPNGMVDLWDTHIQFDVDANSVTINRVTYNPQTNQGLNEAVQLLGSISTAGACYNILGSDANVIAIHAEGAAPNIDAVGGPGCRTIAEVQTNIANWYEYSRRRQFPVKGAISAVIDAQPNFRYGLTLINESNRLFVEVPPDGTNNTGPHNLDLKTRMYQHNQNAFGTPLRRALRDAGVYYSDQLAGKQNPIVETCQKNFTVLFTDGFWNGQDPGVSDGQGDGDGVGQTLADVAYKYYIDDLNTGIPNNVLVDSVESDLPIYNNPPDAGRTHQHMVTFTVAFGVNGRLIDANNDGDPDNRSDGSAWSTGSPTKNGDGARGWGDPVAANGNTPEKIDDLWHAAFNSGGTFAGASTPEEVTEKLIDAITNIAGRVSSAAAVALNSGTLNANSRVYQASFDSNDWSGSLKSIPIQDGPVDILPIGAPDGIDDSPSQCDSFQAIGDLCDQEWDAAIKLELKPYDSRATYSFKPDAGHAFYGDGIIFNDIADLNAAQQTAIRTNPDTGVVDTVSIGQDRMDYIRGKGDNEGTASGKFRVRKIVSTGNSKLGDIIHSAPAFVANPNFFYPDKLESSSYVAYKVTHANRKGMVYVGSNDGMLHAFDASNGPSKGEEVFAYVPGKLVSKLPLLTSQDYNSQHAYYVDGSPIVFDAYNGSWNTLLAGSAGAGAQLVYGLNITTPGSFSASDVLWEFTDEERITANGTFGDKDLGYTIGDVAYARMNDGSWAVIFGNGFNNTEADGSVSATGNSVIYVVNAFTGALIHKFDTGKGMAEDPLAQNRPNGISRVTPIDIDGDFKADFLYAGDLFGNVWKMDVTSATPGSWRSAETLAGNPAPIFVAKDPSGNEQAITTAVAVKRHPAEVDSTLVLFGTGSYITINDATTTQTQTFYAIWDDAKGIQYTRNNLLEQEILAIQTKTGVDGIVREFRVSSSSDLPAYQIDWSAGKHKGWFMDLGYGPDIGERVNVEPILRGNRVIFVTLTPDSDACEDGGTSWIMELNANDGSRLKKSPFDVNGDGIINDLDTVSFGGDTITSGVRSKAGIVAKPGILNKQGPDELKFFSGTTGAIETVTESTNINQKDRQSWRQLR